jgi:hypothetical protein
MENSSTTMRAVSLNFTTFPVSEVSGVTMGGFGCGIVALAGEALVRGAG